MKRALLLCAFLGLAPLFAEAKSYKCELTRPIPGGGLFKTLRVRDVGSDSMNKDAFIQLDDGKTVKGVYYVKDGGRYSFEAQEGRKYKIHVEHHVSGPTAGSSFVDIHPTGDPHEFTHHWVTCNEIEDTADSKKAVTKVAEEQDRKQAERERLAELKKSPEYQRQMKFCRDAKKNVAQKAFKVHFGEPSQIIPGTGKAFTPGGNDTWVYSDGLKVTFKNESAKALEFSGVLAEVCGK